MLDGPGRGGPLRSRRGRPHDVLATHPPRTDGLLLATECLDVATCLGDPERLWVVRIGNLTDPFAGIGPPNRTC